jgi:hypothetical protein
MLNVPDQCMYVCKATAADAKPFHSRSAFRDTCVQKCFCQAKPYVEQSLLLQHAPKIRGIFTSINYNTHSTAV